MSNDEDFMGVAIEQARHGDSPYGAVLVRHGEIVARACNTVRRDSDVTAHAEVNVIREALRRCATRSLDGHTLYATGEPCAMCTGAAIWARLSRIVYGASVAQLAEVGQNQIALRSEAIVAAGFSAIEIHGGVRAQEILDLFAGVSRMPAPGDSKPGDPR